MNKIENKKGLEKKPYKLIIVPIGPEANRQLVDLLDCKLEDNKCYKEQGYEVTADQMVLVYVRNRTSGIRFDYFVKVNGELNRIHFIPDERLASIDPLTEMVKEMLEKLKPLRRPKYSRSVGAAPHNTRRYRPPRKIIARRARKA